MTDLDELDRLHAAATPAPWTIGCEGKPCSCASVWSTPEDRPIANCDYRDDEEFAAPVAINRANATAIAAVMSAYPAMAAELRALRAGSEHLDAIADLATTLETLLREQDMHPNWQTCLELARALSDALLPSSPGDAK